MVAVECKRPGADQVECGVEMSCAGVGKPTLRPPSCKFVHQFFWVAFVISSNSHSHPQYLISSTMLLGFDIKASFHKIFFGNKPVKNSDTLEKPVWVFHSYVSYGYLWFPLFCNGCKPQKPSHQRWDESLLRILHPVLPSVCIFWFSLKAMLHGLSCRVHKGLRYSILVIGYILLLCTVRFIIL